MKLRTGPVPPPTSQICSTVAGSLHRLHVLGVGLFQRTDSELKARVAFLEDQVRQLKAEWERAQLDLLEVSRRASNVIRSLARREENLHKAAGGPNGGAPGVPGRPGLDPISQAILARRKHGLPDSGTGA